MSRDNHLGKALAGILPIHKPKGVVSKDVSRRLQKFLPRRTKIGHVGTLDPLAEGVLPILLGRATKVQDLLLHSPKTYLATFELGSATDTQDSEGEVVQTADIPSLDLTTMNEKSKQFVGRHHQIPPIFSAVKYQGEPLYKYAREGRADQVPLEDLSREIEVYQLEVLSYDGKRFSFRTTCSKGTYIRVLGARLADAFGTLGHMVELVRESTAGLHVEGCVNLAVVDSIEAIEQNLLSINQASFPMESLKIEPASNCTLLKHGRKILASDVKADGLSGSDFILRDNFGNVFGLGHIVYESKVAWIHMKRGLL